MVEPGPVEASVASVVWPLAESLAEQMGFMLVDVTYGTSKRRGSLRIVLDRPGGITLDDVEAFHRAIDPLLDQADPITISYTLEVSSPGAERRLRCARDFRIFAGRAVRIITTAPVQGRTLWDGRLLGMEGSCVLIDREGVRQAIPLESIQRARLRMEA
jgi:ribosome maturation factor RimP